MATCKYAQHVPIVISNPYSTLDGKFLAYNIPVAEDPLSPKERRAHKRHIKRLHAERQAELRRVVQSMVEWPWCGAENRPVTMTFGADVENGIVVGGWFCPGCAAVEKAGSVNVALLRAKERFDVVMRSNSGKAFASLPNADLRVMLDGWQRGWGGGSEERERNVAEILKSREQQLRAARMAVGIEPSKLGLDDRKVPICRRCGTGTSANHDGLCENCHLAEINKSVGAKNAGPEESILGGLRGGKTVQQDRELLERMGLSELERKILEKRSPLPPPVYAPPANCAMSFQTPISVTSDVPTGGTWYLHTK